MRKYLSAAIVIVIAAIIITVQPIRAFTTDVLSIFRVNQVKSINITVPDIEELVNNINDLKNNFAQDKTSGFGKKQNPVRILTEKQKPEIVSLENASDFKAFSFKLPTALKNEKPEIKMLEGQKISFSINAQTANRMLMAISAGALLPEDISLAEFTVESNAMVVAEYDNVILYAGQMPVLTTENKMHKNALRNCIINLPLIPENIREQIAAIPEDSRDIYLPVLVGFGRAANIKGGNTGYIYSADSLKSLLTSFVPQGEQTEKIPDDASVLIWSADGVLYALAGKLSDAELINIAGSIK